MSVIDTIDVSTIRPRDTIIKLKKYKTLNALILWNICLGRDMSGETFF